MQVNGAWTPGVVPLMSDEAWAMFLLATSSVIWLALIPAAERATLVVELARAFVGGAVELACAFGGGAAELARAFGGGVAEMLTGTCSAFGDAISELWAALSISTIAQMGGVLLWLYALPQILPGVVAVLEKLALML
jgi:hypothetical protein